MKVNSYMLCMAVSVLSVTTIEAQLQERRPPREIHRAYSIGEIVNVASDASVQKELGLSAEAAAKVNAAEDAFDEALKRLRESDRGGTIGFRMGVTDDGDIVLNVIEVKAAALEAFEAIVEKYLSELKDVLTAEQYSRLQQITWRYIGPSAFAEANVIAALMITKEQQELMSSIKGEYIAKRQQVFEKIGRPRNTELRGNLAELNKEEDSKVNGVLTEGQLDQFAAMQGREFDVTSLREQSRFAQRRRSRLLRPTGSVGINAIALMMENGRIVIFELLENQAVQAELAIGADTVTKLTKLASEFRVTAREAMSELPSVRRSTATEVSLTFKKMAKANIVVAEQMLPKLKAVLTADQFTRLQQIHWQVLGTTALSEPEMIEALSLATAQNDQITAICAEYEDKLTGMLASDRSDDGQALRQKMRELRNERNEKLGEVLTKDQLERFALLKGTEFDVSKLRTSLPNQLLGQRPDPDFDVSITHPAYTDRHPAVLFDEAHRNFHTSWRGYKALADLMKNDGYQVSPGHEKFTSDQLSRYEILIIVNAPPGSEQSKSAFSDDECDTIQNWVKEGGSLLLIADHRPYGAAASELALRFGVKMNKLVTNDPANNTARGLAFSREKNQIGDHPIMNGRDSSETVNRVLTFTGQSLEGPPGSVALLKFADTAIEREDGQVISASGRAQGVAFKYDRGRVVVMGEAAQLTAQLTGLPPQAIGMNVPGCDNRKMAINLIHWLSALID